MQTRRYVPVIHGAALDRPDEVDTVIAAESIAASLDRLGFSSDVVAVDPALARLDRLAAEQPLLIFNLVEALDGIAVRAIDVVRRLEALGIPFTGAAAEAYTTTSSKLTTKAVFQRFGLPTPRYWRAGEAPPEAVRVIVKSVNEHGSLGIDHGSVVLGRHAVEEIAAREARFGGRFFSEEFVDGREFNVSMLDAPDGPRVLPIAEIDFSGLPDDQVAIVDFAAKWIPTDPSYDATERRFGVEVSSPDLAHEIGRLSRACWDAFDLSGYARVDFRVGADGAPVILEVNANPCLTPDAGFAAAGHAAGLGFDDVIAAVVAAAIQRDRVRSLPC